MAARKLLFPILALTALAASSQAFMLDGRIRDFMYGSSGHPDFEGVIGGLKTGLVATSLNGSGNPTYIGVGGGTAAAGSITSATTFDQWYNDVSGVNMGMDFSIDVAETSPGSGVYKYENSSFFPIDGLLYGNQSLGHNYHFTYEIVGTFQFTAGTGQYFKFTGDDDVWAFFNGKLGVDLGGIHGAVAGEIKFDDLVSPGVTYAQALGMTSDGIYDLNFFFAERHTTQSNFKVETNFEITSVPQSVPEPFTMALMGGAALTGIRKLRAQKRA